MSGLSSSVVTADCRPRRLGDDPINCRPSDAQCTGQPLGRPHREPRALRAVGPGRRSSSKRRGSSPSNKACTSRGSTWKTSAASFRRHRADDTVAKAIRAILRAELIVVDIGLLPVAPDAAEDLYRLVDAAYEKRSVAISSNLRPGSMT